MQRVTIGSTDLVIKQGDITLEQTEAIVNAANERLMHGGGLAAAIARKAGKELIEESRKIGYVPTGSAEATTGGNLPAKYVIHAVGPVWRGGNEEEDLLRSTVQTALLKAKELNLKSISIPAISTGIFGYPIKKASRVLLKGAIDFIKSNPDSFDLVQFVLFTKQDFQIFLDALREVQGIPESPV